MYERPHFDKERGAEKSGAARWKTTPSGKKRLLQESDQSNREIAQACGYCDEFHFSRRFKQATGLSPRQFRQHYRSAGATSGGQFP